MTRNSHTYLRAADALMSCSSIRGKASTRVISTALLSFGNKHHLGADHRRGLRGYVGRAVMTQAACLDCFGTVRVRCRDSQGVRPRLEVKSCEPPSTTLHPAAQLARRNDGGGVPGVLLLWQASARGRPPPALPFVRRAQDDEHLLLRPEMPS